MCQCWMSEATLQWTQQRELHANTGMIVCIYRNVNYLNDTPYDRLFNCLIRLVWVYVAESRLRHPRMSRHSFPLCIGAHDPPSSWSATWKSNEKRLRPGWLANFAPTPISPFYNAFGFLILIFRVTNKSSENKYSNVLRAYQFWWNFQI